MLLMICLAGAVKKGPTTEPDDRSFDGQWKVVLVPDIHTRKKRGSPIEDQLLFSGSELKSVWSAKMGFDAMTAKIKSGVGEGVRFDADEASEKMGTVKWWATTHDAKTMNGQMRWTAGDGNVQVYQLRGTKL
jgi:hypothetical protein